MSFCLTAGLIGSSEITPLPWPRPRSVRHDRCRCRHTPSASGSATAAQARLAEHAARDFGRGSHRYEEWVAAGHLLTTPGKAIDHESIALFIAELTQRYRIRGLAYDRWRMQNLLREFDRIGLQAHEDAHQNPDDGPHRLPRRPKGDGLRIVPWGQGFRDMGPAVDALMKALDEHKLLHPDNPILNWNVANALAVMDPSGFRKLDKSKVRFRIDGAVSLAMLRVCGRAIAPQSRSTSKR
jgi:phage terminase large subunit-like protein